MHRGKESKQTICVPADLNCLNVLWLFMDYHGNFFTLYFHISGHKNPCWRAQHTKAKEDCKCTSHFSRLFGDKSMLLVQRETATDNPSAPLIFCTLNRLSLGRGAGFARTVVKSFNFTISRRPNKQQTARTFPQAARNDLKGDHQHKSKG